MFYSGTVDLRRLAVGGRYENNEQDKLGECIKNRRMLRVVVHRLRLRYRRGDQAVLLLLWCLRVYRNGARHVAASLSDQQVLQSRL